MHICLLFIVLWLIVWFCYENSFSSFSLFFFFLLFLKKAVEQFPDGREYPALEGVSSSSCGPVEVRSPSPSGESIVSTAVSLPAVLVPVGLGSAGGQLLSVPMEDLPGDDVSLSDTSSLALVIDESVNSSDARSTNGSAVLSLSVPLLSPAHESLISDWNSDADTVESKISCCRASSLKFGF